MPYCGQIFRPTGMNKLLKKSSGKCVSGVSYVERMKFFRNAVAPAEEEAVEEQKPKQAPIDEEFEATLHHVPIPGQDTCVLVDESLAELYYKATESKLIKTSKGRWLIVNKFTAYSYQNRHVFPAKMQEVYQWLKFYRVPLPKEVEEWAKSVTE